MKLLLLGSAGQLGSDILTANARRARPFEIACLDRAALDICDGAALAKQLDRAQFDALVNCTGYHKTDEVESQPGLAMAVNAQAPAMMAGICRARGARFFHVSTDYVFGGGNPRAALDENAAPAPLNVYGQSKLAGENLAFAAHDDVTVLRVASLFGVRGASGKGGNFVETMIRLGKERGAMKVVCDQTMSPTATADTADSILSLLERQAPPGLYHAVNSGAASWHEFAAAIVAMAGVKAEVIPIPASEYPTPAKRPAWSVLDNSKLAALTGPIRHWREALGDYLKVKGHV